MGCLRICWLRVYFDWLPKFSGSPTPATPDQNTPAGFVGDRSWVLVISAEGASNSIVSHGSSTVVILDDSIVAEIVRMDKNTTKAAKNRRK
jgi:hypothetical protein